MYLVQYMLCSGVIKLFEKGCPTDTYESVRKSAERYNEYSGLHGVLNTKS